VFIIQDLRHLDYDALQKEKMKMTIIRRSLLTVLVLSFSLMVVVLHDIQEEHNMVCLIKSYKGKFLPKDIEDRLRKHSAQVSRLEDSILVVRFRCLWRLFKSVNLDYSVQCTIFIDQGDLVKGVTCIYWPTWKEA
jgi:hypothetical protein